MDDFAALTADQLPTFHAFREVVFPIEAASSTPTFTIVAGEAGSGRAAAASLVASEGNTHSAVVAADDVVIFDPRALELLRWRPLAAAEELIAPAAAMLQESIAYAQSTRTSLVLEGTFGEPATVFAVAEMFADEGFATRAVIVASRRAESLLAATSQYLWQRQARLPARFTSTDSHQRGWQTTRALASALADSTRMDRATVVGRDGIVLFDAERSSAQHPFAGVATAAAAADGAAWTPRAAAEWFSELRRATDYARSARELTPPVAELLLELHRIGLTEILPAMPFPQSSSVVAEQERRLTEEIVDLRQFASAPRRVEHPAPQPSNAPVVEPARPTGPSL